MAEGTKARRHGGTTVRGYRRRGMALMDVIIGGVILAVGLGVVLSTSGHAVSRQRDAEKQLTASWLADELLNLMLIEGPDQYKRRYDMVGQFDAPFDEFEFSIDLDNPPRGFPFDVLVTVSWPAAGGDHFVQAQTRIAPRLGEEIEPYMREPLEPLDREARYFEEEEDVTDAVP